MKKIYFILYFTVSLLVRSYASHIVGGEITYTYLGNDVYHIKLKVYRDCNPTVTGTYDDPLALGIFNNTSLVTVVDIIFPGSNPVNDPVLASCIIPPDNVCVELAIYETDLTLPPIPGGYDIVYQRCCRNYTTVNLGNPNETGATFTTHINPSNTVINNAATFTSLPPIFLCVNTPFNYDHSAIDIDGDDLVYSFCDPYDGGDAMNPVPNPPNPPPYLPILWGASFGTNYQIAANPQFAIDANTGVITGTPIQFGQYVVGVSVKEYRNGVFMGETRRDFQFNVLPCNNAIASIPEQETFCTGLTVNFDNGSVNSTDYFWNFGDNTTLADTSSLSSVSYTYSAPGIYNVMLVAYNLSGNCVDTAFSTFTVSPLLQPTFTVPPPQCLDNNSFSFFVGGQTDATASYYWDFGIGATPQIANNNSPTNIHFSSDSLLPITIIVSQFGCSDTIIEDVELFPKPRATIGDANRYCIGNIVDFENLSTNSNTYIWNFGVTATTNDTSSLFEPSYLYPDTGIYNITLMALNSDGCSDTIVTPFWVYPLFAPTIFPFNDSNYVNQCVDENLFNFYAAGIFSGAATFNWSLGSNASVSNSSSQNVLNVTYDSAGFFPITVSVAENGCTKSFTDSVKIYNHPRIGYSFVSVDKCLPATVQFLDTSYSETPITYLWNYGDAGSNAESSATHVYTDSGTYHVSLTIITKTGCKDTLMLNYADSFSFIPAPIAAFGVDSLVVSIFNPTIHVTDSSKNAVDIQTFVSDELQVKPPSFEKTFADTGYYKITQIVTNADGCVDTLQKTVRVKAEFSIWVPEAFTPNGDDLNDVFLPYSMGVKILKLEVYDRWGIKIFESNDKRVGWDGKYKNAPVQMGIYSYTLYYENIYSKYETRIGKVCLMR